MDVRVGDECDAAPGEFGDDAGDVPGVLFYSPRKPSLASTMQCQGLSFERREKREEKKKTRGKERGTYVDPAMLSPLEIPESKRAELRFDVHGDAPGEEGLSAADGGACESLRSRRRMRIVERECESSRGMRESSRVVFESSREKRVVRRTTSRDDSRTDRTNIQHTEGGKEAKTAWISL